MLLWLAFIIEADHAMTKTPNYSFHAPTRQFCSVCETYSQEDVGILDSHNAKASSASKFPIHNWYYFVLGYSPDFPNFILDREDANKLTKVADPFMGSGTTLIACKDRGIPSVGVDANNYFYDVVNVKTDWSIDIRKVQNALSKILKVYNARIVDFFDETQDSVDLFSGSKKGKVSYQSYATEHRPKMLVEKYLSDIPFVKLAVLKDAIEQSVKDARLKRFFGFALSAIIVPISNVRYGPGFGVSKKVKHDVDVLDFFVKKIKRMVTDLEEKKPYQIETPVEVHLGDSRELSKYIESESIDLMITSPPYPGDHEYTKHTRLELIFMDYANNILEFREIKKRMVRGSTTNIYKNDNERDLIEHIDSIKKIIDLIDMRLKEDNASSGFEKLYTKLVQEYFGGMYNNLAESYKVLKKGGKYSLLVSDSHAFKMVHIETAKILGEIAKEIGYSKVDIELWQSKKTTSHSYMLRENILTVTK